MTLKAYTLPFLVSLVLHGAVVGLMLSQWESRPEPREANQPRVVQAKVVEYKPQSRQTEEKQAQQNVIDMRERRERQQQEQQRREREQRQQAQREQERKEQERQEQERRERQEREQQQKEQAEREAQQREQALQEERERLQRQQRLEQALAEEEEFIAEQQARQVAQSYVGAIRQRIESQWSRPPSARRGMECVLEIQLVPNGEVVDVTVVESSGSSAFDRSAEQAVRRVERFEVVRDIPTDVFESQFRRLTLKFRPEDLRL